MRASLPALLILTLLASCTSTQLYPNGNLKARGQVDFWTGKQHGLWEHYHSNGQKRSEGSYVDDLQDGAWSYYYTNGELEMQGAYAEHRREGVWEYYHRTGQAKSGEGRFVRGFQDGVWTFWDKNGDRIQQGDFVRGKQNLAWTYWYPGGREKASGFLFDGAKVAVWKFWDREGKLAEKDFEFPPGVELITETWPDSETVRRAGFQRDGKKVGRWITYHRNGKRRFVGNLAGGEAEGVWTVFDASGEPLTAGPVTAGRPTGTWRAWGDEEYTWEASTDRPGAAPFTGEWLTADEAEALDLQNLVETYLAESLSNIGFDDVSQIAISTDVAPTEELLAEASGAAEVPTPAHEWTIKNGKAIPFLIRQYGDDPPRTSDSSFGYSFEFDREGDRGRARAIEGKRLPWTKFETADGGQLDLDEFRGQKNVLLIILRGYASRVCVYCFTQMIAYKESQALERWKQLDTQVLVMYPGPKEGLTEFRRTFEREPEYSLPDFPVLYDLDDALVTELGILAHHAVPTTLLINQQGIVEYAYVGESIEDRPSAKLLTEKLEKMNRP